MKRRTTPPKQYLPPQRKTRHRQSHRPHGQCRCGVTPLPQSVLHPTYHVQQETHPTDNPPQSARKNWAGEARRRGGRRRGRLPSADRHRPRRTRRLPAPASDTPQQQHTLHTHIFTNNLHCRKPAHSRRLASTGERTRHAATVRGRPPGNARRQLRVRLISGRPPAET